MCWTPCFFFLSNKTLGGACITRDVPPIRQSQARPQSFPSNPCPALCSVFYSQSPSLLSPLPLLLPSPSSFAPLTFSFPLLFHPFLLYSLLTHSTPIALSHHCRPSFATPSTVTFLFLFLLTTAAHQKTKKKKTKLYPFTLSASITAPTPSFTVHFFAFLFPSLLFCRSIHAHKTPFTLHLLPQQQRHKHKPYTPSNSNTMVRRYAKATGTRLQDLC